MSADRSEGDERLQGGWAMTAPTAPANWYPDPAGTGGLRYWDGTTWTEHWVPGQPAAVGPSRGIWVPAWKGAQLGLPAKGPGALAEPGRRLGARLLDLLVLLPLSAVIVAVTLLIAAPHFGPLFPESTAATTSGPSTLPTPGIFWLYLTLFGCSLALGAVLMTYETVGVARFGRTLGMAWLHIRPVRVDGTPLGWGRAFARAVIFWLAGFLGWIGLLDPLWCLWDDRRQCLHDKVADSIVINDPVPDIPSRAPGAISR